MNRFPLSATLLCLLLSASCTEEKIIYKTREDNNSQQESIQKFDQAMNQKFLNAALYGRHDRAIELLETGRVDINATMLAKDKGDFRYDDKISALAIALWQGNENFVLELLERFDPDVTDPIILKLVDSDNDKVIHELKRAVWRKQDRIGGEIREALKSADIDKLKKLNKKYQKPFKHKHIKSIFWDDSPIYLKLKEDKLSYFKLIKMLRDNSFEELEYHPEDRYHDARIFNELHGRSSEMNLFELENATLFAKVFPNIKYSLIPFLIQNHQGLNKRDTSEREERLSRIKERINFLISNKIALLQDNSSSEDKMTRALLDFIDTSEMISKSFDGAPFVFNYVKDIMNFLINEHGMNLNRSLMNEVKIDRPAFGPVTETIEIRPLMQPSLYYSLTAIKLFAEFGYDFNYTVSYTEGWFHYPDQSVLTKLIADQLTANFERTSQERMEYSIAIINETIKHMDQEVLEESLIGENAAKALRNVMRSFEFERKLTDNQDYLKFATKMLTLLKEKGVKFDRPVRRSLFSGSDIAGETTLHEVIQQNVPVRLKGLTVTQELLAIFQ